MEYVQMTLNDWMSIKNELEQELRNAAAGFVRIGYLLRKAEESEGYKNDGYDTLTEWAQDNYGLTPSQVSRFKAINKRYSIDGYSNQLKLEYANYGQSKLTEMLTLSDEGMEMVSPEMKRDDIREIKAFERQAPHEEPVQECKIWILDFIDKNSLERLRDTKAYRENNIDKLIEEVNPTGTKTFRTGRTMVSMMKDKIMVRDFPNPVEKMEWCDFFEFIRTELDRRALEAERQGSNVPPQPTIPPMPQQEEKSEKAERMEEQADHAPEEAETVPGETRSEPAAGEGQDTGAAHEDDTVVEEQVAGAHETENEVAPAQFDTVTYSENSDSDTAEEPEQVEIEEILPAPIEITRLEELKDRFREALNTLRVMVDAENFESMDLTIERLGTLKTKMMAEKQRGDGYEEG